MSASEFKHGDYVSVDIYGKTYNGIVHDRVINDDFSDFYVVIFFDSKDSLLYLTVNRFNMCEVNDNSIIQDLYQKHTSFNKAYSNIKNYVTMLVFDIAQGRKKYILNKVKDQQFTNEDLACEIAVNVLDNLSTRTLKYLLRDKTEW